MQVYAMRKYEQIIPISDESLPRTSSCSSTTRIISTTTTTTAEEFNHRAIVRRGGVTFHSRLNGVLRSVLLSIFHLPAYIIPACTIPTHLPLIPSPRRRVTGTLFGHRRGHVSFAVQVDPSSEPIFIIDLAVSTATLVREMSSAMVRIVLECEKAPPQPPPRRGSGRASRRLFEEPVWTMYCNGRESGYAKSRTCTESDWHVLSTVRSVSVGAGVIPVVEDRQKGGGASEGELLFMRARFERVVGNRDSEAYYMLNPDGNGGRELSIFLLRI